MRRTITWPLAGAALLLLIAGCRGYTATSPAVQSPVASTADSGVPLFENLGTHHHPITTAEPQAQRYFDQGLRLTYAFNHGEAIRAFKEGVRLDPNCAMCFWGVALALGPNINAPMDPKHEPVAYEAIQRARAVMPNAGPAERAYIDALTTRYAAQATNSRTARDAAYADAMRDLARRYPKDPDAATLFAEALMDLRPWDYWTADGRAQPGTTEIVSTLETVIREHPNHPGACHYYIHAVEATQPERAVPCAERLADLMPGAGHLVHMPAHIYMRVGRYQDAVESNRRAAAVDEHYIKGHHPEGFYPMAYYPHNLHFLWSAASMEGRSADALNAARDLAATVPETLVREAPPLEAFTPTRLLTLARFGRWRDILDEPSPPADFRFTTGMWHYARGLAFAATQQTDQAQDALSALTAITAQTPPDQIMGLNSAKTLLTIASNVLAGEIAARRGNPNDAIPRLKEAVRLQDGLTYFEPPDWYYPVRQSLGAVLLAAGRAADAEAVYRKDLAQHPENGWSLYGLAQALRAQQAAQEAATTETRFRKAWARADVTLSASRF